LVHAGQVVQRVVGVVGVRGPRFVDARQPAQAVGVQRADFAVLMVGVAVVPS
jgi:hypothetical protein